MKSKAICIGILFGLSTVWIAPRANAGDYQSVSDAAITVIYAWYDKNNDRYGTRVHADKLPTGCKYMYIDGASSNAQSQLSLATAALLAQKSVVIQKRLDSQDTVDGGCFLNTIGISRTNK